MTRTEPLESQLYVLHRQYGETIVIEKFEHAENQPPDKPWDFITIRIPAGPLAGRWRMMMNYAGFIKVFRADKLPEEE